MRARVALLALLLAGAAPPGAAAPGIRVERVADGVYAVLRTDPPGLMFEANAGFIVGARDVIVVDGGSNPESARAVLAELRRVTRKPVRYVVNTHWHDDHVAGNQVYCDAFPGVEFIAHATAVEDMERDGAANRRQFVSGAPGAIAGLGDLLGKGRGMDGQPLTDEERASHESSIALAEKALRQAPSLRPTTPTVTFTERMTLAHGGRTIELRWLGRAHTRGDIVVELPREGVVFTGDLVSWPVPLVGTTSFPLEFGATVERLIALHPRTMVPGHGPVLHDDAYARTVAEMLASLKAQTEAAVARGASLEETRRGVDLSQFRRRIAGDSKVRNLLFTQYVQSPAVARAWEAARAARQ